MEGLFLPREPALTCMCWHAAWVWLRKSCIRTCMPTPIFHLHLSFHHSFKTCELVCFCCQWRRVWVWDFEYITAHCAICRCNGCRLSRYTQLLLFVNLGWQILDSLKMRRSKSCCKCGKASKEPKATRANDVLLPDSSWICSSCHRSGSPCLFLCILRLLGVAPRPAPH